MNRDFSCDILVIGAGLAGMAAGARAAVKGLDVIVAGNPSALSFASGILDYLGVYPAGGKSALDDVEQGVNRLVREFPGHPYALAGGDKILGYFEFIRDLLAREGLPYTRISPGKNPHIKNSLSGLVKNFSLPTAMGTLRPGFMVPETMAEGAVALETDPRTLLVAGIKGLAGFSAAQAAQGLESRFEKTIFVSVELPGTNTGVSPQILAGYLEEPEVREALVSRLLPHAVNVDIIGLPAVCGIGDSPGIMADLKTRLNTPLFEIPGVPPSIPGLRLKNAFEKILARAGARLLSNVRISEPVFDGKRFTLTAGFDPSLLKINTRAVILATGRFFGGGLHARRERIVEPVFHLDVAQPTGRSLWHDNRFFSPQGHAINLAGIETDICFRPLDERGRPVYDHLYAAGAILAHNDWARLKSGAGTAIVSACTAVDAFIETEGGAMAGMAFEIILVTVFSMGLIGLIFRLISIVRLGWVFERDKTPLSHWILTLNYGPALLNTLFQIRLFRAGKFRWLAHFLVLSGFVWLVFVHALDDWTGVLFDWYQPGINPFRMMRNLAGVMVLTGCTAFLVRRLWRSRINLERQRRGVRLKVRGTLSIMVILGLIFTGFMTEALNIMSEDRFNEMVEEYSGLAGEPELIHLKGYWARYYDLAFAGEIFTPSLNLDEGRVLNQENCLECHTRPKAAFVSAPLARLGAPLGRWAAPFRPDRILYWIHLSLALTLVLFFPFSRMFHLVAIPLASIRRRVTPDNMQTNMGILDLAALSACTHCGFCSQVCSVYPDYQISENPQVLPHVKLETLKRLAGKGVWDPVTVARLRSGNDDCTRCGLCADICPSGIDLVRLWTAAGRLMDRLGCPDNYTSAMDASFSGWMGRSESELISVPGGNRSVGRDERPLSGLINDAQAFEHCVQCTLCTNACPVAAHDMVENDLGPHQVMNLLRLGEQDMASGSKMVWHCLTCYACQEICPQSIRVADILLELRCRGQSRAAELTLSRMKGANP